MSRPMLAPAPSLQVAPPAAFQPPGSQPQPLGPGGPRPIGPALAPTSAPTLEPGQIITKTEAKVVKVGHGADAHYVAKLAPEEKKRRKRRRTIFMFALCLSVLLFTLLVLMKMRGKPHEEEAPAQTIENI